MLRVNLRTAPALLREPFIKCPGREATVENLARGQGPVAVLGKILRQCVMRLYQLGIEHILAVAIHPGPVRHKARQQS